MKKAFSSIIAVMAFSACAIGQVVTNTMPIIAPVTVTDLPSAIMLLILVSVLR
jgi:hypothetical protein